MLYRHAVNRFLASAAVPRSAVAVVACRAFSAESKSATQIKLRAIMEEYRQAK